MRNGVRRIVRYWSGLALALAVAWGCAPKVDPKGQLAAGYQELDQKQYDAALNRADAYLREHPTGGGTAEALYLKGRAYEQRPVPGEAEAQRNLQAARSTYQQALLAAPSPKLKTYIRVSLGNVAFFQDDYVYAVAQWRDAQDSIGHEDLRGWLLYRIGLSQQRLGQFSEADQSFVRVQQEYPGSEMARRAGEHKGSRSFYLQVGVFGTPAAADKAVADLRAAQLPPAKFMDAQGRQIVRAGPMPQYAQARSARVRLSGQYPDAMIVPGPKQ